MVQAGGLRKSMWNCQYIQLKGQLQGEIESYGKKAALKAETAALQEQHQLDLEELQLKRRISTLELRTKPPVVEAEAEEQVCAI